jgi:hypothetical protein
MTVLAHAAQKFTRADPSGEPATHAQVRQTRGTQAGSCQAAARHAAHTRVSSAIAG